MNEKVIVKRNSAPDWDFEWSDKYAGLVHKTKDNVYKLFFENPAISFKPIWIGRLVNNGTAWVTWEKELRAKEINLCGSKVIFTT